MENLKSVTLVSVGLFLLFQGSVAPDPVKKLKWIAAKDFAEGVTEPAGYDPSKDALVFVGRALYGGGLVVGYYAKDTFNFATGDGEANVQSPQGNKAKRSLKGKSQTISTLPKEQVQVLVYPVGTVSWQPKKIGDGKIPVNMILGGVYPGTREHTFICRGTSQDGSVLIGYYRLRDDNCVISAGGKAEILRDFQVMSLNFYGMSTGAGAD